MTSVTQGYILYLHNIGYKITQTLTLSSFISYPLEGKLLQKTIPGIKFARYWVFSAAFVWLFFVSQKNLMYLYIDEAQIYCHSCCCRPLILRCILAAL